VSYFDRPRRNTVELIGSFDQTSGQLGVNEAFTVTLRISGYRAAANRICSPSILPSTIHRGRSSSSFSMITKVAISGYRSLRDVRLAADVPRDSTLPNKRLLELPDCSIAKPSGESVS
jgi:hypothetical protein